ncbi:hypothetical protein Esti_001588 [Eimeria stiedai]
MGTENATAPGAATAAATAAAGARKMEASVSQERVNSGRTIAWAWREAPPLLHGGPLVSSVAAACLLLLLLSEAPLWTLASPDGGFHAEAAAEPAGAPHNSRRSWASSLEASLLLGGPWGEQKGGPWNGVFLGLAASAFRVRDSDQNVSLGLPMPLQTLISVSFACLVGCLVSFCFLSASHLRNYYEPKLQRMVCRIGCALPLFALLSTAACFSVFSELGALHGGTTPYEAISLDHPGSPPPSTALRSSSSLSRVAAQAATATAPAAAAAASEAGPEGASKRGPPSGTVETPWLEGAPFRELSAAGVLLGAPSSPPSTRLSLGAFPALPVSPEGASDRLKNLRGPPPNLRGPPPNASEGDPLRDEDHHTRHRRPYYLQQQLFFELGKQLTQSTALYSFSSLMVNACGGYRCLSLTLGCDGHLVPYVFPLSLLLRPFLPNPKALRLLKLGVMQFVLVLPLWTAATLMADHSTSQPDPSALKASPRGEETIPAGEEATPGGEETIPALLMGRGGNGAFPYLRGAAPQLQTHSFDATVVDSANTIREETTPGKTILGEEEGGSTWISRDFVLQAVLGLILSLSMFASMMSLSQFYLITRPYLSPYSPEEKFLSIQLLVFTNSWQRLIVGLIGNLWGLPGVCGPSGIGLEQGIDLYHNLLTNIWAFAFSLLYWRCFPVSDHLPEVDDEAVSYLENPKKPSIMHALLDVCFSVDLIADAHEAVLAPQMSLDRAFSLLHQQTISHQAFLKEWTEMDNVGALQTPLTAASPQHERRKEEEGLPPFLSEHTTTGEPATPGGPVEARLGAEEGPLKVDEALSEAETSRGLLSRGDSRTTAGTRRSYWGPRLPWGPFYSPSVTSSHLPRRMATVSVYSNSSSLHPTSAAAAAAAAALAEAATIGSYRSKRARDAARARISALACPTSPYSTDLTAALAIALGDAAPAFPVSISLLSRRLAAMSLTRNNSSSSTPAPPAPPSLAPLRKWASGGAPGGPQRKSRGRGGPNAPRRSSSAMRLRKPSAERREEATPGPPQEAGESEGRV